MGLSDWLKGNGQTASRAEPESDIDDEAFSNVIHIPSRNFIGLCTRSPNRRFTLAWLDGGPDQSRQGRYLLLDGKRVVAEGTMPRPNDGKVTDAGVFVLNDWGAIETLNGTFMAFGSDGRLLVSRAFSANLFDCALSPDGCFAVCQTCNSPTEDSNLLTLFDLMGGNIISAWRPESGWAKSYEFSGANRTIRLIYPDGGAFAYSFDGTFLDRMRWFAAGLQKGDIPIIEKLLGEGGSPLGPELAAQILPATRVALGGLRQEDGRARARVLKSQGICFEALAELKEALACYDEALTLDPKVGVKRRVDQLRKVV
jgi:hypothetical protein